MQTDTIRTIAAMAILARRKYGQPPNEDQVTHVASFSAVSGAVSGMVAKSLLQGVALDLRPMGISESQKRRKLLDG